MEPAKSDGVTDRDAVGSSPCLPAAASRHPAPSLPPKRPPALVRRLSPGQRDRPLVGATVLAAPTSPPPHLAELTLEYATKERFADFHRAAERGFQEESPESMIDFDWPYHEPDRFYGYRVGERWVSTFGAFTRKIVVPGGAWVPTAGGQRGDGHRTVPTPWTAQPDDGPSVHRFAAPRRAARRALAVRGGNLWPVRLRARRGASAADRQQPVDGVPPRGRPGGRDPSTRSTASTSWRQPHGARRRRGRPSQAPWTARPCGGSSPCRTTSIGGVAPPP